MKLCIPSKVLDQHLVVLGKTGAGNFLSRARFTAIIGLLFCGCPPTVIWGIWAIIIRESVQRMSCAGPFSHILKKSRKTPLPAHANGYASVCIIFSVLGSWIQTSIFHALPHMIFSGFAQSMSTIGNRSSFTLKATTGKDFHAQMILPDHGHIPAVAMAFPKPVTRISWRFFIHN